MPPARRSTTSKSTARTASRAPARAAKTVRARADATKAATRREVEQSIARFEKRLDDANDALATLGKHLGRGAQSSYKEVTATMRALRRDAAKTNKQALKDFDQLRAALTKPRAKTNASGGSSRSKAASGSRTTGGRTAASRSTSSRSTTSRSPSARSRAKKS